jgi:hypothetical protein
MSQPAPTSSLLLSNVNSSSANSSFLHGLCFSQPALPADQFFLPNESVSGGGSRDIVTRLVRRMTRFLVRSGVGETVKEVTRVLDSFGYAWKVIREGGNSHQKPINVVQSLFHCSWFHFNY